MGLQEKVLEQLCLKLGYVPSKGELLQGELPEPILVKACSLWEEIEEIVDPAVDAFLDSSRPWSEIVGFVRSLLQAHGWEFTDGEVAFVCGSPYVGEWANSDALWSLPSGRLRPVGAGSAGPIAVELEPDTKALASLEDEWNARPENNGESELVFGILGFIRILDTVSGSSPWWAIEKAISKIQLMLDSRDWPTRVVKVALEATINDDIVGPVVQRLNNEASVLFATGGKPRRGHYASAELVRMYNRIGSAELDATEETLLDEAVNLLMTAFTPAGERGELQPPRQILQHIDGEFAAKLAIDEFTHPTPPWVRRRFRRYSTLAPGLEDIREEAWNILKKARG